MSWLCVLCLCVSVCLCDFLHVCIYVCAHACCFRMCTIFIRIEAQVFISYKWLSTRSLYEPFLQFTWAFISFRVLNPSVYMGPGIYMSPVSIWINMIYVCEVHKVTVLYIRTYHHRVTTYFWGYKTLRISWIFKEPHKYNPLRLSSPTAYYISSEVCPLNF